MNTPGPWTLQPIGDETECNILGAGRELIATVSDNDARLIAAAPALLHEGQETADELEGLADWLDSIDSAAGIARKLRAIESRWRAAIAKVTTP